MRKIKLLQACLFLAFTLIVLRSSSCNKGDDNPTNTKTRTDLISQGTWKIVKVEGRTNPASAWTDYTSVAPACNKDDLYIFRANHTYEINEGASKCNVADPQIVETGTWSFESNETQLKFTVTSGTPYTSTIEQLDDNTLIYNDVDNSGGSPFYYRLTFGH